MLAVGRLLYLGQAQSAQEGTYTCECSNAAGNSSQEQQLEVLGEPGRGWGGWVSGGGQEGWARACPSSLDSEHTGGDLCPVWPKRIKHALKCLREGWSQSSYRAHAW